MATFAQLIGTLVLHQAGRLQFAKLSPRQLIEHSLTTRRRAAGPTAGTTYELTAIAAVVIGGAALTGGRGTVRGTMLGAFVIGFLSDGLVIIGVSSYWQTVFTGAVIVLAVLLNSIQYGRRSRAS